MRAVVISICIVGGSLLVAIHTHSAANGYIAFFFSLALLLTITDCADLIIEKLSQSVKTPK